MTLQVVYNNFAMKTCIWLDGLVVRNTDIRTSFKCDQLYASVALTPWKEHHVGLIIRRLSDA